jgi:hypothetical protein
MLTDLLLLSLAGIAIAGPPTLPAGWVLFSRSGLPGWLSLVLLLPLVGFLAAAVILVAWGRPFGAPTNSGRP